MRILYARVIADGVEYKEIAGLSTESKPTSGLCMGSKFIEVNTNTLYLFNETSGSWGDGIKLGGGS